MKGGPRQKGLHDKKEASKTWQAHRLEGAVKNIGIRKQKKLKRRERGV